MASPILCRLDMAERPFPFADNFSPMLASEAAIGPISVSFDLASLTFFDNCHRCGLMGSVAEAEMDNVASLRI